MITKLNFFINALKAEAFRRRAWVFSAFAIINNEVESTEIYPYQIKKVKDKYAFVDPNYNMDLTIIEDSNTTIPLINHKEIIRIDYTAAANLPADKQMVETTFARIHLLCSF